MSVKIEDFTYPLADEERRQVIEDNEKMWTDYWLNTARKSVVKPLNGARYQQAYLENVYKDKEPTHAPYAELEFIEELKAQTIKDFDRKEEFFWDFINMKAEQMAMSVNHMYTCYCDILIDRTLGKNFVEGFRYNYFKSIATGKDPKAAYMYAVAHAEDKML